MKIIFYIVLVIVITLSCKSFKKNYNQILITNDFQKPPGCVKIETNLYLDEAEITNSSYCEFLYWINKTYPNLYSNYLPDSKSWNEEDTIGSSYVDYYLWHPAYRDFPVVGISYEQALAYTKWRSDRVMEYILIKEKVIKFHSYTHNEDSIFTIQKYFNGKFAGIKPNPKFKWYPEYTLPDSLLYVKVLEEYDSIYPLIKNRKLKYRFQTNLCNCLENKNIITKLDKSDVFIFAYPYYNKKIRFYNLRGNVRELTNIKGLAFGGSYLDSCSTNKNLISKYDSTDVHTGFRNMCVWKRWPGM